MTNIDSPHIYFAGRVDSLKELLLQGTEAKTSS